MVYIVNKLNVFGYFVVGTQFKDLSKFLWEFTVNFELQLAELQVVVFF